MARRKAWYRQDYKLILEGNLTRLKAIAEVEDYEDTENKFMTREQKRQLKATPTSVAQMNDQQSLAHEMQYQGRVAKTLRTWKPGTENTRRLQTEAERKKRWILERINYGKNGMGGLGMCILNMTPLSIRCWYRCMPGALMMTVICLWQCPLWRRKPMSGE
ncbi:hypothetical protein [Aliamphritea spongicola]|nr:hypothetical protein [Aliamphritea spongicola]